MWLEWAAAESNVIALDCRCLACACVPTTQLVSTARGVSRSTMTDLGGRPTEAVARATRARVRIFGYSLGIVETTLTLTLMFFFRSVEYAYGPSELPYQSQKFF